MAPVGNSTLSTRAVSQGFSIRYFCESVIIGRCSNYILKDRDDCLNIFVYAPEEYKVKHIMEQKGVSQKEAQKLVKYNDGMLKSRYEYMTSSDMRDCRTRHMMIDSSILGLEKTAKYIMQLIDLRFEN